MPSLLAAAVLCLSVPCATIPERDKSGLPHLRSESVVVRLADTGIVVLRKNPEVVRPIASVTKLLSGLVIAALAVDETQVVTILEEDKDRLKWSRSHVPIGVSASWAQLAQAALGASENRAMYAVVRAIMSRVDFVALMNRRAAELGMTHSRFVDPAGIDPGNVSTANDLLQLLAAAAENESIRRWSLATAIDLQTDKGVISLRNPDRLVHSQSWEVVVGKTGYIVEAGRSFVVRVRLAGRPVDMVFLGSREMASVFGDAGRVKRWLQPQLEAEAVRTRSAQAQVAPPQTVQTQTKQPQTVQPQTVQPQTPASVSELTRP